MKFFSGSSPDPFPDLNMIYFKKEDISGISEVLKVIARAMQFFKEMIEFLILCYNNSFLICCHMPVFCCLRRLYNM